MICTGTEFYNLWTRVSMHLVHLVQMGAMSSAVT